MNKNKRVLFLYKAYPFTIANYYRRALERRGDVELLTCGEFFGQWIPWSGGLEIPMKYFNKVDMPLARGIDRLPWNLISSQFGMPKFDLVINVDAGFHLSTKPDVPYVVVGTDPHVLQDWYDDVRPKADIFYSMQTSYMREGDKFLNYAFDPFAHYPVDTVSKEYDCSIIGLHYTHRDEWVNRLRAKGVTVNYRIGDIFDEYREENNKAWIGLNWSSLEDVTARVFEICAMKLVPVLNRLPGLDKLGFEEGRHYLGFSTMDEAVERVLWAKENPDFAKQIALQAHNFVHESGFTYDENIRQIFKDVGLE